MARWQPPHPAKTITRPVWQCAWHDCREEIVFNAPVQLCFRHTNEVRVALKLPVSSQDGRPMRAPVGFAEVVSHDEGWVYYLAIGDLIKIGYATNVRNRMRSYPPNAQLLAVEPGNKTLERTRHQQFDTHLRRGREWFADVAELRTWIHGVREEHGNPALHASQMTDVPAEREWRAEEREQRRVVGGKRIRNRRW